MYSAYTLFTCKRSMNQNSGQNNQSRTCSAAHGFSIFSKLGWKGAAIGNRWRGGREVENPYYALNPCLCLDQPGADLSKL
jgi:hypothetical protein